MNKLSINFAPLSINENSVVRIGSQAYNSELLRDLRREFSETHVFRRDGDAIVDIPVAADAEPLGKLTQKVDLAKEYKLWPSLMQAALLRIFAGHRDIYSDYPVTVIGSAQRSMLRHTRLPVWLQRRTSLAFETRTIFAESPSTGLVIETRARNFISGNCEELLEAGVPLIGRWIQVLQHPTDRRLMPRRKLVGKAHSVSGDRLNLEDHEEGYATVALKDAYIEARAETFEECVRSVLGPEGKAVLEAADNSSGELNSGPGRMSQIEEALKYLRSHADLQAVPGVRFNVAPLLRSGERGFPKREVIKKPTLVFDPAGNRTDDYAERALKRHGPYDQQTHTPKKLRIAVICEQNVEGQVDAFVAKFLHGMPTTFTGSKDNQVARYGDGFIRRFHLENPSVKYFTAKGITAASYVVATRSALEEAAENGFQWDLALVQVEEQLKGLPAETNPYYATKAHFLKLGVPVQAIRLETMAYPDTQLVFAMNHVSLATYAKLGGVPWLLAAQQRVAHELVIGLGSHTASTSRIGARQRYVGITTVFSSDGSYVLSEKTAAVPYEQYAAALSDTVSRSIAKVRRDDNWRSTDKVRLVFHVFKPLKDAEAEAIKRAVDEQGLSDVTFAFLHIAPDHPYVVFDEEQQGIGYRAPKKGVLGPSRGLHLKLGDYESLVVFSGASELKQASDGMPRPCLLKLHRLSTFRDMTYLARQAFEFAGNSWRMLAPEPYPITIRYSDLIAERLTGLSAVSGWDPDAVHLGPIGRTLWFL